MFLIYHQGCYARHLARALRVTRAYPINNGVGLFVKEPRQRTRQRLSALVNWGVGPQTLHRIMDRMVVPGPILNANIRPSVLKMNTFEAVDAFNNTAADEDKIRHPVVTRDAREVYERGRYLGRRDGLSGGEGITIFERGQLPAEGQTFDFFSLVVTKIAEVRLHVFDGTIICEQVKYTPAGAGVLIRNYDNGARFSNKNIENHDAITADMANAARRTAINTARALGLNFGAVDIMFNRSGNPVLLEFNSAPGLSQREDQEDDVQYDQPSTYDAYLTAFRSLVV